MDWRRLERGAIIATIALYVAAVASLAIMLGDSLLPEGSRLQGTFHRIANHLTKLGDIGGGTIIVTILIILVGGGTGMLLLRAYDQYQENRKRRARERAEAIAEGRELGREQGLAEGLAEGREQGLAEGREQGLAEGLAEGREQGLAEGLAEGRAEVLDQLRDQGVNLDDFLTPDEADSEPPETT